MYHIKLGTLDDIHTYKITTRKFEGWAEKRDQNMSIVICWNTL